MPNRSRSSTIRARSPTSNCSKVHFATHDPTTLNRQGNDVGTQYRSAIFYANQQQKELAEAMIADLDGAKVLRSGRSSPRWSRSTGFYPAEAHHQNYVACHPQQPYVRAVALPKVAKVRAKFKDLIKPPHAKPRRSRLRRSVLAEACRVVASNHPTPWAIAWGTLATDAWFAIETIRAIINTAHERKRTAEGLCQQPRVGRRRVRRGVGTPRLDRDWALNLEPYRGICYVASLQDNHRCGLGIGGPGRRRVALRSRPGGDGRKAPSGIQLPCSTSSARAAGGEAP